MRVESPNVARIAGRRTAFIIALASLGGQVANYLLALHVHRSDDLFMLGAFALLVVLLGSAVAMTVRRREATAGVLAGGTSATISIGDEPGDANIHVRPAQIRGGWCETINGIHQVTLQRSRDALAIRVASAEEGNAILDAANVSAAQRVLTLQVSEQGNPGTRGAFGCLWLLSSVLVVASLVYFALAFVERDFSVLGVTFALVPVALFAWCARALLDRPITIGRDGVRFGAVRPWFLPYRDFEANVLGEYVVFMQSGRTHRVKTTSPLEARAIVARIEAARRESSEAMARDVVARGGRDVAEWRAHLRGLIAAPGDYRAATLGPSELVAIAEDATASMESRVGATVALSVLPRERAERARVRVAIETAANPALRVALEHALDGELDEAMLARA